MPFPDDPCPACPRVTAGLPLPCRAMDSGHRRFCELAASGNVAYIDLMRGESDPGPDPDKAAIMARRARKLRVPLGTKVPAKRGGG